MNRRTVIRHAAQLACLAVASQAMRAASAAPDDYPDRPIRIIVPSSPATPPDIICRMMAAELARAEGWEVTVENRTGAIGAIGGADVLRQPADGYTLYAVSLPIAASPALLAHMNHRLDRDFIPVIKVSVSYNVLVDNPSVPATTVAELVAYLKASGGKVNFSSGGFGTPAHLIGELFKLQTGVQATHVPYNSIPQAIIDLIGGANQYMFVTILPVVQLIKAGRLRALAVTAPTRVDALKDVPSIVEEGFSGLVAEDWVGLVAKTGTPPAVVTRLNRVINAALARETVRTAFAKIGAEPAGGTPDAFGAYFEGQLAHWQKVVKDAGIKMSGPP